MGDSNPADESNNCEGLIWVVYGLLAAANISSH